MQSINNIIHPINGLYIAINPQTPFKKHIRTLSYAYLPIVYDNEKDNTLHLYPINIILSKTAITFYHDTESKQEVGEGITMSFYQSDSFLCLPLDNPSQLEKEIQTLGEDRKKNNENIFLNSKGLDDRQVKGYSDSVGVDYLNGLLPENTNKSSLYKILFLNFLADFFYSDVFGSNPHYKAAKAALERSATVKALLAKGKYLYSKQKYQDLNSQKEVKKETLKDNEKEVNPQKEVKKETLKDNEKEVKPQKEVKKETLKDNEKEVKPQKEVYKKTFKHWEKELKKKTQEWHQLILAPAQDNPIQMATGWFEGVEKEHKALRKNDKEQHLSEDSVIEAVDWLSQRYDLWGAFWYQMRRKGKHIRLGGMVIASIFIASIFIVSIFIALIFTVSSWGTFGKEIAALIFLPPSKIFYAFSGWVVTGAFVAGFLVALLCSSIVIGEILFVIGEILLGLFDQQKSRSATLIALPKLLRLFKLPILVSSAAVWAFLYLYPSLWNIDLGIDSGWGWILFLLMSILSIFTYSKLVDITQNKNQAALKCPLVGRSLFLILLSYVYSILIGIGATNAAIKTTFIKEGYYKDLFEQLAQETAPDTTISVLESRLGTASFAKASRILEGTATNNGNNNPQTNTAPLVVHLVADTNHLIVANWPDSIESSDTLVVVQKNNFQEQQILAKQIIKELKPPADISKLLFKQVLLDLKKSCHSEAKLVYRFSLSLPFMPNTSRSKWELYIIPDFLIFYAFLALVAGMFIELFFKKP